MIYLIGIFLIAGVALILLGLREAQQEAPEASARLARLRTLREELAPDAVSERERDKEFVKSEEKRAAIRKTTFLPSVSKLFSSNELILRLEEDLSQARSKWRASELIAGSVLLSLVVFIIVRWSSGSTLFSLAAGIGCLFIPWLYVKGLRAKYFRKFDEQLSDTLMLISNSLKAGFSFLQAMEMVAREAQPPMADEFGRVTQEIAVGVSIADALENLGQRIHSMDLDLMITAVLIQREIGGSLAEILETIAAVIRERVRIKGEIRTLTTQGRATGAVLGAMPISLGLLLHFVTKMMAPTEPSFVEPLITTTQGQWMLAAAAVMQIMGFATIMKIVAIKV
jgi:tight adherence protein B